MQRYPASILLASCSLASQTFPNPTLHPGFHLVLAFEALGCACRESVASLCPFTTLFSPRVVIHRRLLRAAAVSSLEESVSGTGHFCLLLKMHVDKIFMKCQQEISKHTSMHLHVRTPHAQNPERALKMTGMHPRTRGWEEAQMGSNIPAAC